MKTQNMRQHIRPGHREFMLTCALASFSILSGLCYLYFKYQTFVTGSKRKNLEIELDQLIRRSRDLEWQLTGMTSRTTLQGKISVSLGEMENVIDVDLIHVRVLPVVDSGDTAFGKLDQSATGSQLQPVLHSAFPGVTRNR